jgi:hypothetical protein
MFAITAPVSLEVGKTYVVTWNGTEYVCAAQDIGGMAIGIGNTYVFDASLTDTGEPFVIAGGNMDDGLYGVAVDINNEVVPFSIYQDNTVIHKLPGTYLPDGVPYVEKGMTDTLTFDGNIERAGVIEADEGFYYVPMSSEYVESSQLLGGTLTFVGLEEDTPNGSTTITEEFITDITEELGVQAYVLGDFVLVLSQDATLDGITIPKGISFLCAPVAFYVSQLKAPSAVLSGEVAHKIDPRCLPNTSNGFFDVHVQQKDPDVSGSEDSADKTFAEILAAVKSGALVRAIVKPNSNPDQDYYVPLVMASADLILFGVGYAGLGKIGAMSVLVYQNDKVAILISE